MHHGVDAVADQTRLNLKADRPVTAPAYSASRSPMARQIGLASTGR
jgi:predicted transcriptional regulator